MLKKLHSDDTGKLLLRLMIGGLMLFHGVFKVQNGIGKLTEFMVARGLPAPLGYGVYLGEVLAPLMIILGIGTRIGGLLITGTMMFAIYIAHVGDIGKVTATGAWGIELPMVYLVGGLALVFLGAGRFSVSRGKWSCD